MRIGFVDFEMSNLSADFGILLCGCVKECGGKLTTFRIDATKNYPAGLDKTLAQQLRDELERYDMIVTYNGSRFDIPFLNSRLLLLGCKALPPMKHLDLLYTSRFRLRLHSNRLDAVAKYFCCENQKTPLDGRVWIRALMGSKGSMNYIVRHCIQDVKVLENVYNKIKSQIRNVWTH